MKKLSFLLKARTASALGNAKSALGTRSFTSQTENHSSNFINGYTVFKGKAALSTVPILPASNESQTGSKYDKKGCVLLTFWPAIGERKYDWQKRQAFALSPTELGSLISLEPGKNCEFFHDPSMKSSNAGQVRKSLSVTPLGEDGGYLFNFSVVNSILKTNERFSVPVSKAEYTVMRTAFTYILPHIMGWNPVSKQMNPNSGRSSSFPVRQQQQEMPMTGGATTTAYQWRQPQQQQQQVQAPKTPNLEWDR